MDLDKLKKSIQAKLMKLDMWTGNVLIIHVVLFPLFRVNCGYYGNGNSQNVAW